MSKRSNRSEPGPGQDRTYQWIGEGDHRGGAIHYHSVQVGTDTFKVGDTAIITCYGDKESVCHIEELFENVHTRDMEMRVRWYYWLADVTAQYGKKIAQKMPCLQDRELFFTDHKELLSVECISRKAVVIGKRQQSATPMKDDTFLCQFLLNTKDASFSSIPLSSHCLQEEDATVGSSRKRLRDESDANVCNGGDSNNSYGNPCQQKSPKRKCLDVGSTENDSPRILPRRASRNLAIAQIKNTFVYKSCEYSLSSKLMPSLVKGTTMKRPLKVEQNGKTPQSLTGNRYLTGRKVTEMTPELKLSHNKESPCRARKSLRLSTAHVVDLVTSVDRDSSYSLNSRSISSTEDESSQESFSSSSHTAVRRTKQRNQLVTPPHASKMRKKSVRVTSVDKECSAILKKSSTSLKKTSPAFLKKRSQPLMQRGHDKKLHSVQVRLHVSAVPRALPCRGEEFEAIMSYVETRLFSNTGGCMYISGVPGTGKTATVKGVAQHLQEAADRGEIPPFKFIELNGMQLTEPRQAFVTILKQLTGEKASASRAAVLLEEYFGGKRRKKGAEREKIFLLADELDMLWTRKQSVLYCLFDWPARPFNCLTVVAVANTMDLPERIMANKVASRMCPTRLTFHPYTFQQLQEIALSRIGEMDVFAPDAVQLAARKVAAVSGDARRVLDICRRAAELAQQQSPARTGKRCRLDKTYLVGMDLINQVVEKMCSSPMIMAIRKASHDEKMFLRAVVVEFQRTGLEEANMKEVYHQFSEICQLEGNSHPSLTAAYYICQRLWAMGVLLVERASNLYRRIRLYMSPDDVLFALRQDK